MKGDAVYANSRDVAAYFGIRHDNIIQGISTLHVSFNFAALNFQEGSYFDVNGQARPAFDMTKRGFTRLVFGFTGKKAGELIEAYIDRFEEMEASLKASQPDLFTDHLPKTLPEALRMAADAMEKRDRLEQGNKVLRNDNIKLIGKFEETEAELNVAKETIGKHDHPLTRFARMLDSVKFGYQSIKFNNINTLIT